MSVSLSEFLLLLFKPVAPSCRLWMWTGTCDYSPSCIWCFSIGLHGVSQSGFIWDGAYEPMTTKVSLPT